MAKQTRDELDDSPLDWLERSFELLLAGPRPLMVNGRALGEGLPMRMMTVAEIRQAMPGLSANGRDAVWRYVLRLARSGPEVWMVVSCGLALPGLRTAAGEVARGYRGEIADLDGAVLEGFVRALREIDLALPGVCGRLWRAAYNSGRRARYAATAYGKQQLSEADLGSSAPAVPVAHPDLVLAHAVHAQVLSLVEAELIGRVHLERRSLRKVASELDLSYGTAQRTLRGAKSAIALWLGFEYLHPAGQRKPDENGTRHKREHPRAEPGTSLAI